MKHLVKVAGSGEQFSCTEEQHLLQGMQSFRIGEPLLKVIPVGCRGGGCGVCRIRMISGEYEAKKMSRKHVTEEEQSAGIVLACRVFPRGDLEIEVLPVEQHSTFTDQAGERL